MYQRIGQAAYKADLVNTLKLAIHLGHPETSFKSIHVAGTNGKGSTSHMLASVLQEAGYKVGLYTSPHLKDFRERIKINGAMMPKRKVSSFIAKHKAFFENHQLSFFEMTVGLAFDYFREEHIDIAVVEVGMGGRLDSTNIITPEVSVITNIGWDHTQYLGDKLEKIAAEKGGIIKQGVPVVIGENQPETRPIFQEMAISKDAPILFAEDEELPYYPTHLRGAYQKKNQRTVLAALKLLKERGWRIKKGHIQKGLRNVVQNTGLLGRWQTLQNNPTVVCDTAHNKDGLLMVMQQIASQHFKELHMVIGVLGDKDLQQVLPLFPKKASYYFCQPNIPRALPVEMLYQKATEYGLVGTPYPTVKLAFKSALKAAGKEDFIYVGGSTFVVAEVL